MRFQFFSFFFFSIYITSCHIFFSSFIFPLLSSLHQFFYLQLSPSHFSFSDPLLLIIYFQSFSHSFFLFCALPPSNPTIFSLSFFLTHVFSPLFYYTFYFLVSLNFFICSLILLFMLIFNYY